MNSKHKVIQWNRTSKLVEKEVPRHMSEISRLSLMMTATIVYENMQEDFREKKYEALLSSLSIICFSFTNLASFIDARSLI